MKAFHTKGVKSIGKKMSENGWASMWMYYLPCGRLACLYQVSSIPGAIDVNRILEHDTKSNNDMRRWQNRER